MGQEAQVSPKSACCCLPCRMLTSSALNIRFKKSKVKSTKTPGESAPARENGGMKLVRPGYQTGSCRSLKPLKRLFDSGNEDVFDVERPRLHLHEGPAGLQPDGPEPRGRRQERPEIIAHPGIDVERFGHGA